MCPGNEIKTMAGDALDCSADPPCDAVTQEPNDQHTECGLYFLSSGRPGSVSDVYRLSPLFSIFKQILAKIMPHIRLAPLSGSSLLLEIWKYHCYQYL